MSLRINDHGDHICFSNVDDRTLIDHVPAGVYLYRESMAGRRLDRDRKKFDLPDRTYGEHQEHFRMITQDYDRMGPAMGISLVGVKGSGKSMLGERICNWAIGMSMPVYRIDEAMTEEQLRFCIAVSGGSCVLYFDEFGKTYKAEQREQLLSFLGDNTTRGVIMIYTANDKAELSEFMLDRPGRCRFCIEFEGLQVKDAREIAAAHALNEERTVQLCRYSAYHLSVSYDVLVRLARLMVDHVSQADLEKVVKIMNIPGLIYNFYEISDLYYDGERQCRENLKLTVADDTLSLSIYDDSGNVLVEGQSINLFDVRARHTDNEIPYPEGLQCGQHVLDLTATDGKPLRLNFRRALAELVNRWEVNVPTKQQLERQAAESTRGGSRR